MALELTAGIDASEETIAVTGTVPAEIGSGYVFSLGDEILTLRTFGAVRRALTATYSINRNSWVCSRGQAGSTAVAHLAAVSVFGVSDAWVAGTGTGEPEPIVTSGGGGGAVDSVNSQTGVVVLDAGDLATAAPIVEPDVQAALEALADRTLAQTLVAGNDTGGLGIVNHPAAGAADITIAATHGDDGFANNANIALGATVFDGAAFASIGADAQNDGSADSGIGASTAGSGAATITNAANAAGGGTASNYMTSTAGGAGGAYANVNATSVDGTADTSTTATASGSGDALTHRTATASGSGNAGATTVATAAASSQAEISATANTVDGSAIANRSAITSGAGSASATTTAESGSDNATADTTAGVLAGSGNASALRTAVAVDGDADASSSATASGTGTATTVATATSGARTASIGPVANATRADIQVNGVTLFTKAASAPGASFISLFYRDTTPVSGQMYMWDFVTGAYEPISGVF